MNFIFTKPWLKSLSGLFINISAAWFMAAALTTNITKLQKTESYIILCYYLIAGLLYLLLSVKIEEILTIYDS